MPRPKTTSPRARKTGGMTHDVIIIGGGLSGGTLACLLGQDGFRVACIDSAPPVTQIEEAFDGRTTAVSYGSRKVLEAAGAWSLLQKDSCPIRTIEILDGGSPVLLRFGAEEIGGESFGWIMENRVLRKALFERMRGLKSVDHHAPAQITAIENESGQIRITLRDQTVLSAPLVVGADGRNSFVRDWAGIGLRGWSYRQRAIVCTVVHDRPHHNVAVEHFRAQGPFAILPMTDGPDGEHRSSVVWTEHGPARASAIRDDQDSFDAALTARFPESYGTVRQIGLRASFPLWLQHAYTYTAPRVALIADAAHGIHPIAGQGLNLGFRDIDALWSLLTAARESGDDFGGDVLLQDYERLRRVDNMAMAGATDILNRLFSNAAPGLPLLRQTGLRLVARMPAVKRFFMHQAMGRRA